MTALPWPIADTCDDCPACHDEANWTECCAACHCCPDRLRCDACRPGRLSAARPA